MRSATGNSPECSVTIESHPPNARIVIEGELVVTTTSFLEGAVTACLRERPATLTVELGGVRFLDCAGITALLTCCSRARSSGTRVHLVHPSGAVLRMVAPGAPPVPGVTPRRHPPAGT